MGRDVFSSVVAALPITPAPRCFGVAFRPKPAPGLFGFILQGVKGVVDDVPIVDPGRAGTDQFLVDALSVTRNVAQHAAVLVGADDLNGHR